jgi:hypothetical protein
MLNHNFYSANHFLVQFVDSILGALCILVLNKTVSRLLNDFEDFPERCEYRIYCMVVHVVSIGDINPLIQLSVHALSGFLDSNVHSGVIYVKVRHCLH